MIKKDSLIQNLPKYNENKYHREKYEKIQKEL